MVATTAEDVTTLAEMAGAITPAAGSEGDGNSITGASFDEEFGRLARFELISKEVGQVRLKFAEMNCNVFTME